MGGSSKPKPQTSTSSGKTSSKNTSSNTTARAVTGPSWAMGAGKTAQSGLKNISGNWWDEYGSGDYNDAWDMARMVARGEDPYQAIDSAQNYYDRVLAGDFLYGGDAFNAAVDAAYRAGMPGVLSAFGQGGRSDGGLAKVALAQAFADPFARQYRDERMLQDQSAKLAPGMALMPASILEGIGAAQDQRALQEAGLYTQMVQAAMPYLGSTTTQTGRGTTKGRNVSTGVVQQPYYEGNPLVSGIGGAFSGAATGATIGSAVPAVGTGVGALAGGLLGGIGAFA